MPSSLSSPAMYCILRVWCSLSHTHTHTPSPPPPLSGIPPLARRGASIALLASSGPDLTAPPDAIARVRRGGTDATLLFRYIGDFHFCVGLMLSYSVCKPVLCLYLTTNQPITDYEPTNTPGPDGGPTHRPVSKRGPPRARQRRQRERMVQGGQHGHAAG